MEDTISFTQDSSAIAVVGMGCWYPGAPGLRSLWENILARRCEFRRIPASRLSIAEYHSSDPATPDKTYGQRAALLDGFQFDWAKWRVPRSTFASTDIVHWLALTIASQALQDAGLTATTMPRDRTGVIVGNTLTGEHTRSQALRVRWPFVRRALQAAADQIDLPAEVQDELSDTMEAIYKSAFAPVSEDTLAGGLSNTIAGRICNYLDLHGGGYTVDGACCSSLLAIATAAQLLDCGDLDVVLAGGVDVSLDPFELIGFAKTGALSPGEMRVYDRRAEGFIPAEGCGFVVLKRLEAAQAAGDRIYAIMRGWGVSSDGKGGLMTPGALGQRRALDRAHARAGYRPDQLHFIEGHGTATRVGDTVELEALGSCFSTDGPAPLRVCGVTSFKSIFGHTKAAAGVGAFIKTAIAVNRRIIPPTAGCDQPNVVFDTQARSLYPVLQGQVLPAEQKVIAGVSAMGFGGINAHVTLESGDPPAPNLAPDTDERALLASHQETELFVWGSANLEGLCLQLKEIAPIAEEISVGELTDLAVHLAERLPARPLIRAAIIAGTPAELAERICALEDHLRGAKVGNGLLNTGPRREWWAGRPRRRPRLGFLFPGQGSQQLNMARALVERFPWARELAQQADEWVGDLGGDPLTARIFRPLDRGSDSEILRYWEQQLARTEIAQPAVCLAALLYGHYLDRLGLRPAVVAGHSLGELIALRFAGALEDEALLKLAAVRGRMMAVREGQSGAMASLGCGADRAAEWCAGASGYVTVAALNSPGQTVISGDESAVQEVVQRTSACGISAHRLPVAQAFHSRLVAGAARQLAAQDWLPGPIRALRLPLFSSMTGRRMVGPFDLRAHLAAQMTAPVQFMDMVRSLGAACDQLIEVGPGRVLSGLVTEINGLQGVACVPVAGTIPADRELNMVLARAYVSGVDVRWKELYDRRLVRPFIAPRQRLFIDNPCERPFATTRQGTPARPQSSSRESNPKQPPTARLDPVAELVLNLVAERTGFARATISPGLRLLDDLNLDSIKAAELIAAVARALDVTGRLDPSLLAKATLADIVQAMRTAADLGANPPPETEFRNPAWVRDFAIEYVVVPA